MNRAYTTLTIKAVEGQGRRFAGIASTISPDRAGDVVEPKGARFKLPIPLLWQHDMHQPIGWVTKAAVTHCGIEVEGEITSLDEEGSLKERLTNAWHAIKSGLVRGLSVGFKALDAEPIAGGMRFKAWEWLELSAVTIPANADASITAIKSIDHAVLAKLGEGRAHTRDRDCMGAAMTTARDEMCAVMTKSMEDSIASGAKSNAMLASAMAVGLNFLLEHVEALEKRLAEAEQRGLKYQGTWQRARDAYTRGDVTTHAGLAWVVVADKTATEPGASMEWQLMVKAGKDAR